MLHTLGYSCVSKGDHNKLVHDPTCRDNCQRWIVPTYKREILKGRQRKLHRSKHRKYHGLVDSAWGKGDQCCGRYKRAGAGVVRNYHLCDGSQNDLQ